MRAIPKVAEHPCWLARTQAQLLRLRELFEADTTLTEEEAIELRSELARLLTRDEFPLTRHGKIDKARLPAPQAIGAGAERVPPATLIETVLVDMYATVIGHEDLGATDSFFDLGGNSLQAMQLVTLLQDELEVDIAVAAMFLAPTPRQVAALLRDRHGLVDDDLGADGADDEP